jgi:hypothetical protein
MKTDLLIPRIPLELYHELKTYLTDRQYWRLLTTANRLFTDIRYCTRRIYLDHLRTTKFLDDNEFCSLILSKIRSPYRQLSLNVTYWNCTSPVLSETSPSDLSIHWFQVNESPESYEKLISNRSTVSLRYNDAIVQFPPFTDVECLSLSNFHKLSDIHTMGNFKKISLYQCNGLVDVSCLKDLQFLSLKFCEKIVDVSSLGRIPHLEIQECPLVQDISELTENYSLKLFSSFLSLVPTSMNTVILEWNLNARWKEVSFPNL